LCSKGAAMVLSSSSRHATVAAPAARDVMADVKKKTGECSARLRVRFREGVKTFAVQGVRFFPLP
jgi:hypothetical protein